MKALCITMGPDWPVAKAEFERVGLKVEPLQAIVEDNRVLSFNKSVYECMKLAEGDDLLLFEDDVMFDLGNVNDYAFPDDALTVHLGCNLIGSDIITWQMPTNGTPAGLARLHNCWQSHATFYSAECVKFILDNFKFVTDEYKTEGCQIFDEWLRVNVLPLGRSYVLNPMIAYQRPRWSEIWNRESDYTGCHKQGNEWLKNNLK
jgi:hypothetical protein